MQQFAKSRVGLSFHAFPEIFAARLFRWRSGKPGPGLPEWQNIISKLRQSGCNRSLLQAFRLARSGKPLPNPRLISASIHRESTADTQQFTMLVMQWGQFLDHDVTFTPQSRGFNNSLLKCCSPDGTAENELLHPDCKPIFIPDSDRFYSQFNATCMEFARSSPAPRRDCSLGPRDQINQVTGFIDASNVYGSTEEEQRSLRLIRLLKLGSE